MIGATSGLMSVYVDAATAREIFGPDDAIAAGVTAPMGMAQATADGYRVTGRWPFASGCEHAGWRMGGAILTDEPKAANGAPAMRCLIFRADQTRVVDTWHVSGLRGTGSHDVEVSDALVPRARSFSLFERPPGDHRGVCAAPFFGLLATAVAAVAIGIARGALDAFLELATEKRPLGSKRTIAHRELVQLDVAKAEAKIRGAHALLIDAAGEAEREALADHAASLRARAVLRAAAAHATSEAASAVEPRLRRRRRDRDLPKEPAAKALSRRPRRHPARHGRARRGRPRRPRAPRRRERHLAALNARRRVGAWRRA